MIKMRKNFVKIMLGALLLSCICILGQPVQAASQKSKALKAYKTFLSKDTVTWHSYSPKKIDLKKCKFALAYIDKDSVPELILDCAGNSNSHADGYYELYTYKNGKVKFVTNLMDGFSCYKKKGIFCAVHEGTGGYGRYYYQLSKGKAVYKFLSVSEKKANMDLDGDGRIGVSYKKVTKARTPQYESSMVSVSKSAFNRELKKIVGNAKNKTVKYYPNTANNRTKHLK